MPKEMNDRLMSCKQICDGVIEWKQYDNEIDVFNHFTAKEWEQIAFDIESEVEWNDLLTRYHDYVKCYVLWRLLDSKPIGFVYLLQENEQGTIVSIHGGGWERTFYASLLYNRAIKLLATTMIEYELKVRTSCRMDNRRAERFLRGAGFVPYRRANGIIDFWINKQQLININK